MSNMVAAAAVSLNGFGGRAGKAAIANILYGIWAIRKIKTSGPSGCIVKEDLKSHLAAKANERVIPHNAHFRPKL